MKVFLGAIIIALCVGLIAMGLLSAQAANTSAQANLAQGIANTAANVASLGAQTRFLSVVGNDHEGKALRRSLHAAGVPTDDLLIVPGRRTLVKRRILGAGQMLLRVDAGDVEVVNGALERALLERLTVLFEGSDVVIVSDYGYGILTPTLIAGLAVAQRSMPRVLVVDAKDLALYQDAGVTVAKPNYAEALALLIGRIEGSVEGPARHVVLEDRMTIRAST